MITAEKPKQITDEKILELIRKKNTQGYNLFYKKYWKQLLGYTSIMVPDKHSAEEIVQGLFISLFTKGIRIKNIASLPGYLRQAIRNRVANQYRDRHNYIKHLARQQTSLYIPHEQVMKDLDIHDLRKELHRCLEKLPPKYTIVFIMNKDQQMTLREIAHKLERPEGTVEKQLRRVVRYLKENLNVQN